MFCVHLERKHAEVVALNGVLTAPPWLMSCSAPRGDVKHITVITMGRAHPTYTVRIEHCNCDAHPFLSYLLIQRLFPLTFKEPSTALSFELMDHLDQVLYTCTCMLSRTRICTAHVRARSSQSEFRR